MARLRLAPQGGKLGKDSSHFFRVEIRPASIVTNLLPVFCDSRTGLSRLIAAGKTKQMSNVKHWNVRESESRPATN
jgi:hypothetical protein